MNLIRKERLPQLDVYRALALIGVLHVHASSYAAGVQAMESPFYYVYNFMNIFFKFGTSSFIFLSGFVLFYNYYDRPITVRLLSRFYGRRVLYILLPYVIASTAYFVYTKFTLGQLKGIPYSDLWIELRGDLLTGTAYTHLYFVFISIQFYILFPFLLKLFQSKPVLVKWAIPIGLILQWAFVFYNKYELHFFCYLSSSSLYSRPISPISLSHSTGINRISYIYLWWLIGGIVCELGNITVLLQKSFVVMGIPWKYSTFFNAKIPKGNFHLG